MVVDDHPMWRDAVARDLAEAGYDVVADGRRRRAGAARRRRRPGRTWSCSTCSCPTCPASRSLAACWRRDPAARVLILSASGEQQDVLDAVKAGATGYLLKSAARAEFLDAVRRTASGDAVFTPGLAGARARRVPPAGRRRRPSGQGAPQLTERETEILRMVAKGMSYKQIADRLVLSHRTVQNHVQNTLGKLQLHNRVELVRYAIEHGLAGEWELNEDLPGGDRMPRATST